MADMTQFFDQPTYVENDGVRLATYQMGPDKEMGKPTLVFMHGFPELAYSWRHQVPFFAAEGYPVICFDGRGYGLSDAPKNVSDYDMRHLVSDIVAILDHYQRDKVVFVGHDWGALVLWSLPFYIPDRILGLVGMNVPFKPRRELDTVTILNKMFGEDNYINWFQTVGPAEALFEEDIAKSFRFFMRKSEEKDGQQQSTIAAPNLAFQHLLKRPEENWPGHVFLSDDELGMFVKRFQRHGFFGPINWYRNFKANWQDMERHQPIGCPKPQIPFPCLMFTAAKDPVAPPAGSHDLPDYCPDLEMHCVQSSGHWTQQEAPDEVNRVLLDWLQLKITT